MVVIEHNLDVIKTADWIIDLGPEGGAGGGQIIATGTPEEVSKNPVSITGKYLGAMLKPRRRVAKVSGDTEVAVKQSTRRKKTPATKKSENA